MGVKQGCILSPLLFALFINDIQNDLKGGIKISGEIFKLLAFADDIVFLAESKAELQAMIKVLENYCALWNLQVNLDKSKIMIFRNGGKVGKNESFWFMKRKIEVVQSYKYLGVLLTSNLNLSKHFERQIAEAGLKINWSNRILYDNNVPLRSKFHLFNAIVRSSLCYGAQVWGVHMYPSLEVFQRAFLKKVLRLPLSTPDYMLYLECNVFPMFVFTLELHLYYKNRCLNMPENRYPNFLLNELFKRKIFWYESYKLLAEEFQIPIDDFMYGDISLIIDKVRCCLKSQYVNRVISTQRHMLYKEIYGDSRTLNIVYNPTLSASEISWALKTRGELMFLNKYSFKSTSGNCSLCNLRQEESVFHFVAVCPILAEWRRLFFGKSGLDREEFLEIVRGNDLKLLAAYCRSAWAYRFDLTLFFNY